MKSLVDLNAELDALQQRASEMIATGEREERKFTADEDTAFAQLLSDIEAKKEEIRATKENQVSLNKQTQTMEKKNFSLLAAIRGVVDHNLDEISQAVIAAGREEMRAAALSSNAHIVIPVAKRAAINVGTSNKTVPVEVANIFDEIRAKSVLAAAGATYLTGLAGDIKVPVLGASTVGWEGEVGTPSASTGSIGGVLLQPKRLTAYMDISKQLLLQSSPDVEAALQANLVRAVQDKLEATVFGSAAGDATKPAGMFNGQTPESTTTFAALAALEATVDGKDNGEYKYILSPSAKAAMRGMTMNNSVKNVASNYVLAGGEVDGVPALTTANMTADQYIVGFWNRLVVAQFGGIEITVDPFSRAANGEVRLVINAYVDAKVADANAFAYGKVTA